MATKDELLAFAEAHGIGVDSSMLKADIEAAISDAGYDPYALEESDVDEFEEAAEEIVTTSSDSKFSTYTEVEPDPEIVPAPGRQVEETRGTPTEVEPK